MAGRNAASDRQKLEAEERRREILQLRITGMSIGEISRVLNLAKSTVSTHVSKALREAAKANLDVADKLRALQLKRLDKLLSGIWVQANNGLNPRMTREARAIIMAQSKLLGLEAPIKIAHTDPSGNEERTPADWTMPLPQPMSTQEWAAEMQALMKDREATAEAMVNDFLSAQAEH